MSAPSSTFWYGVLASFSVYMTHSIFTKLSLGSGRVRGQPRDKATGQFVTLSYGETHYRIHGADGSPKLNPVRPLIILVHGFAGSSNCWEVSLYNKTLSDAGYDVLSYDNWGHGYSEGPDCAYSAELFSSQLAELLVALDISKPFDLLGFSLGGAIVSVFAHRYPRRIKKIIYQAPSVARGSKLKALPLALVSNIPFLRELLCILIIPHFGEGANSDNSAVVRAAYRLIETSTSFHNMNSWLLSGHSEDLFKDIVTVQRKEVMFLWGDSDNAVDIRESKRLREIAPDAPFVTAEGGDHMTFAELDTEKGRRIGELFRSSLIKYLKGEEVINVEM